MSCLRAWLSSFSIVLSIVPLGCSSSVVDDTGSVTDGDSVGQIAVELTWFDREFSRLSWRLIGLDNSARHEGSFDISQVDSFINAVIDGVGAGDYRLELETTSDDGARTCRGTASMISVVVGETTEVFVLLLCDAPADTGGVDIEAIFDDCPGRFYGATLAPTTARVGEHILITLQTSGDWADIQWSVSSGELELGFSPTEATYTCVEPGTHTIAATVYSGYDDCPPVTREYATECLGD
jgi:hypothetical protein